MASLLPPSLSRDIAAAFHLGLRKDGQAASEAKDLALFLYGLAQLAEAKADPDADPDAVAQLREHLATQNEEKAYGIKSALLEL